MVLSVLRLSLLVSSAAHSGLSATIKPRQLAAGQCEDITIPVQASADNRLIFSPTDDLTTPSGVTSFLSSGAGLLGQLTSFIPESGTYIISGRYCAPATGGDIPAERASHVQILLHGIPYNKDYWSGLNYAPAGDNNNWLAYATSQGYPALAIDNIGHGNSSKPDPVFVVQQALETVILHEIIQMLRAGTVNPAVPTADKVIFVGHSLGSVTGNGVASKYPATAFDAAILTGYTYTAAQSLPGILTDGVEPAELALPARFGDLPPAYLTFASEDGKRNTYYGDDGYFDAGLPPWDVYNAQDTVSVGELVSAFSGLEMAKQYTGDVFVLTGEEDAIFCGDGTRLTGVPHCGEGSTSLPARSQSFWPAARSYEYYVVPHAGHAVTLHLSAQDQFARAHQFLAQQGY